MVTIRAKSKEAETLLSAGAEGRLDELRKATDHALKSTSCSSGCSSLHWAAGSNQIHVLEYLVLERRLPVDLPAVKKSKDRTALHYACRNGCLETVQWLVKVGGADPNFPAKHGVTPFQLAVWQNRLEVCQWLVEECQLDAAQLNVFSCGAVHWIGICPQETADLIPMARWLSSQPGITFYLEQKQGHTALHKAAWGGHLELIRYLHNEHGMWDDGQDNAGNFAADLCDMANTPRHAKVAEYLRCHCSRARAKSCAILGIETTSEPTEIRRAYLEKARMLHPDNQNHETDSMDTNADFDALHKAYRHLVEDGGRGRQSNPSHSLRLMLELSGNTASNEGAKHDDSCFKARLLSVILEYSDKGLDVSNVKKKWKQVWPSEPFPDYEKLTLSEYIETRAGEVVELRRDEKNGNLRVYAKHLTKASVE